MTAAAPRPPRPLKALLLAAVAGGALAGCPSQGERTCDVLCDCRGCSEAKYLACVDEVEAAQAAAAEASAEASCPGAMDELLVCLEDEGECKDDSFTSDACKDQEGRLRACGIFLFGTVCEQANAHTAACGQGEPFQPGPESCPEELACAARCMLDATCEGMNGFDLEENQRFNECNIGCFQRMR
ncbi:hypothetical protein BE08_34610 [Sorangium cellulosum]|uniref:Secreted protein n=1 Tax=Sorangium cellulosum TaxID=56 RepID=A0A150PAH2_SORCE|nr:hypothetical protein BE08_34610 [Sorangium cellulosum]